MGGHALKKVTCIRISKTKYLTVLKDVVSRIEKYFPVYSIPFVPEKESFGDLDLIHCNKDFESVIKDIFNPVDCFINGKSFFSFSYHLEDDKYFQVDLFYTKLHLPLRERQF